MKKNIIIVILTIIVIGLSGYIVYDKILSNNENKENNIEIGDNKEENNNEKQQNNIEIDNKNEEDNNEIKSDITWVDYLLEQKFVSASLSVCRIDDKYVYDKDIEWQPNPGTGRNITKEELKKILNTIYESERGNNPYGEVVKSYGYAAPACEDEINYKYIHKDKEYDFTLASKTIIITEDEDFIKILNNYIDGYPNYALNKSETNYNNLVKEMMKDHIKY